MNILLIGSYNGQESFGDKCLLSSVIAQFQVCHPEITRYVTHIDTTLDATRQQWPTLTVAHGFSFVFNGWRSALGRLRLPFGPLTILSLITFPFYVLVSGRARRLAQQALIDTRSASLIYFYGGTQLSAQWFWLNFPGLLITAGIGRCYRIPVYFGPQQYGPLFVFQKFLLTLLIRTCVKDIRVRNEKCLSLLGLQPSALTYDEVFSCGARYPLQRPSAQPTGEYLLLNCRSSNFWSDTGKEDLERFAEVVAHICETLPVPLKLVQMSDATFCDDTPIMTALKARLPSHDIQLIPYGHSDFDLIDVASKAVGVLSMSFHACILSMIGGIPAVPVTTGLYYDHKYVDFDKYSGLQETPVINLRTLAGVAKRREAASTVL